MFILNVLTAVMSGMITTLKAVGFHEFIAIFHETDNLVGAL